MGLWRSSVRDGKVSAANCREPQRLSVASPTTRQFRDCWRASVPTCGLREGIAILKTSIHVGDLCPMAQVCELCGRKPAFGNKISHAHNVTKRRWNLNLQSVRALVNGAGKRMRVCTSCIRDGKVQKDA